MSCASGCCLAGTCVPVARQGHETCGFFGDACNRCQNSENCVGGKCDPSIDVDAGFVAPVGSPCGQDRDCASNGQSFCIPEFSAGMSTGFVGGYCSRLCQNVMCPSNARCVAAQTSGGGTTNVCLAACVSAAQCRTGYVCDATSGQSVCLP